MTYRFTPARRALATMNMEQANMGLIRPEPMLFSCDVLTAFQKGGPLTQDFLERSGIMAQQCFDGADWIIDSRVHMLMPGWYPCIPGWHHDDVPRDRSDGQPSYDRMAYESKHIMAIMDSGTGSYTEFVDDMLVMPEVPLGKVVYREWDELISLSRPKTSRVKNGEIVEFLWSDMHRGMPAVGDGWRWFIRASTNTKRPFLNELRTQVQVYMSSITSGW